jgi:hypothetical protein
MGKAEDSNIFDAAGRPPEKKKKKKPLDSSFQGSTVPKSHVESNPSFTTSTVGDMEVEDMIKKLRNMDQDLQNKMQRICELSGMTKKEVEKFIENPHNFTDAQWRKVQLEKDQLEEKIYTAIGVKAKKRILKKKKMKLAKGRKGKTLGGRKGWLQM